MTRKRIEFWLDDKRDEDTELLNLIAALKSKRQFSRALREGLRTWSETEQSELANVGHKNDSGAGGIDLKELAKEVASQIILQGGTGGLHMQSLKPTGKQIAAPNSIAMPNFDDDELPALSVKKDKSINASLNFMQSISGLM
jgi:hypothetical protein